MTKEYRNKTTVTSHQGVDIDPGSLWILEDERLILLDDDEYQSHELSDDFEQVK